MKIDVTLTDGRVLIQLGRRKLLCSRRLAEDVLEVLHFHFDFPEIAESLCIGELYLDFLWNPERIELVIDGQLHDLSVDDAQRLMGELEDLFIAQGWEMKRPGARYWEEHSELKSPTEFTDEKSD
jgi:hypothetical protein